MSLSDLASLGSFVSSIAVLISLVYVAMQIRQATKHSRAQIQQGRAARIVETSLRLAEIDSTIGFDKCFNGELDVTPEELRRFLHVARAIFISAEDSFFQQRQGLTDDRTFKSFVASVKGGMGSVGLAAAWKLTREMYEPEFQSFMDKTMGEIRIVTELRDRRGQWRETIAALEAQPRAAVTPANA